MKSLKISVVSAAILAAASFGAQAQQPQQGTDSAPGMSKEKMKSESGQKAQSEHSAKPDDGRGSQAPAGGDRAGAGEKPKQGAEKSGDMNKAGKPDDSMNKGAAQGQKQDDRKSADQKPDGDHKAADQKSAGDNKAADQKPAGENKSADQKPAVDNKSADQKPGGDNKAADQGRGGGKQASKEIKPEQKTVIKETIVKEHIRPEKINVQVRIGVAIPRTVVLYPLPPTIIEIYPHYSRYKLVMVDDNTILVIDPDTWMIVDVIEV